MTGLAKLHSFDTKNPDLGEMSQTKRQSYRYDAIQYEMSQRFLEQYL